MTSTSTPADAVLLTCGMFRTTNAKVAHGLVRGGERFRIRAVVDPDNAGQDAGQLLDGRHRDIPVVASLARALESNPRPRYAVVGIATHGGRITPELRALLLEALEQGLSVVNGLHDFTNDDPGLVEVAHFKGAELIDVRRPPPRSELRFWEGEALQLRAARIAVLGTDCAIGKRTTARLLTAALNEAGIRAEMIYTGQTGWMQGGRYGFILDSTPNDFVCGELERALVDCAREVDPEVMVIEGQAALRNPSGPCGSEFIISGGAKGVILQHAPGRSHFGGHEDAGIRLPTVEEERQLIRLLGGEVLGVTLHSEGLDEAGLQAARQQLRETTGLPVVLPLSEGMEELVAAVRRHLQGGGA